MLRRYTSLLLMLTVAAVAAAERQPGEPIPLALTPKAAPSPALKYQLLPEVKDTTPGNAVQLYYRAFSPEWMNWYFRENNGEKILNLVAMPFADFARSPEAKGHWIANSKQLMEVDRAARRSYCDWELTDRVKSDGMELLLPDIHSLRNFANMLALRVRLALIAKDYDQAIYTLQTGLAMSRHAADAPLLIHALVGCATTEVMLSQLEDFVQQPGAPNLYWALTYLPQPFIDLHKPFQGERMFLDSAFPDIKDLDKQVLTAEQVHSLVEKHAKMLQVAGNSSERESLEDAKLMLTAMTVKAYPGAKRFLIAQGRTPQQVDAMPAFQAALMHARHQYFELFDETIKWQSLPYWQAKTGYDQAEAKLKAEIARMDTLPFARLLLPAIQKVTFAQARVDRRIAALRCIEAIRLYAAAHEGKLPAALTDIKDVPLPVDPVFGKNFEYQLDGDKALLIAPPPWKGADYYSLKYEVTIAR